MRTKENILKRLKDEAKMIGVLADQLKEKQSRAYEYDMVIAEMIAGQTSLENAAEELEAILNHEGVNGYV